MIALVGLMGVLLPAGHSVTGGPQVYRRSDRLRKCAGACALADRGSRPGSSAGATSSRSSWPSSSCGSGSGRSCRSCRSISREQGVDLALLGLVIAAWPAARLVGEPVFGWLADRTARVPLMVIGLIATGIFSVLPLVFTGPLAFVLLRAGSGLATAAYDPAARGYLTDATPPERRGEAFGLYGAVQMGGLLLGPRSGRSGPARFGGISFVFVFGGVAALLAAIPIVLRARETRRADASGAVARLDRVPARGAIDRSAGRRRHRRRPRRRAPIRPAAPTRLWNRGLIAVLVINAGGYFAGGTYEVIWSLFLQRLGAGLDLIGLTFAMFGLPVLLLSPFAGRLVDRRGSLAFIIIGSILPAIMGLAYTRITDPTLGGAAHPHRGDRVRDAQPGALRGRRRELAARAHRRPRRASSARPGRSASSSPR